MEIQYLKELAHDLKQTNWASTYHEALSLAIQIRRNELISNQSEMLGRALSDLVGYVEEIKNNIG